MRNLYLWAFISGVIQGVLMRLRDFMQEKERREQKPGEG